MLLRRLWRCHAIFLVDNIGNGKCVSANCAMIYADMLIVKPKTPKNIYGIEYNRMKRKLNMAEKQNSAITTNTFFVDDGNYVYFALPRFSLPAW